MQVDARLLHGGNGRFIEACAPADSQYEFIQARHELRGRGDKQHDKHGGKAQKRAPEHHVLEANIMFEAADQQNQRDGSSQDADNDDAGGGGEPDPQTRKRGNIQRRTQSKEERCKAEVRHEPAREGHPLQNPDDEARHHDGEGQPAAEHAALEHIVAARAWQRCGKPDVHEGNRESQSPSR